MKDTGNKKSPAKRKGKGIHVKGFLYEEDDSILRSTKAREKYMSKEDIERYCVERWGDKFLSQLTPDVAERIKMNTKRG